MTDKLNFIVGEQARQASQDAAPLKLPDYPDFHSLPWWTLPATFLVPVLIFALAKALSMFLSASGSSVFLIGEEIKAQGKRQARREKIVWGIGVALLLGVLGSVVGSWLVS